MSDFKHSDFSHINELVEKKRKEVEQRRKMAGVAGLRPEDEDDDEGGGGVGKGKERSYNLEGLKKVLGAGKLKAKKFWRFLAREGLNTTSDISETTLDKSFEKGVEKAEIAEKAGDIEEGKDRAKELLEERAEAERGEGLGSVEEIAATEKQEREWGKPADKSSGRQRDFLGSHNHHIGKENTNAAASFLDHGDQFEHWRRGGLVDSVAGSHARMHHGDHQGAVRLHELGGTTGAGAARTGYFAHALASGDFVTAKGSAKAEVSTESTLAAKTGRA